MSTTWQGLLWLVKGLLWLGRVTEDSYLVTSMLRGTVMIARAGAAVTHMYIMRRPVNRMAACFAATRLLLYNLLDQMRLHSLSFGFAQGI